MREQPSRHSAAFGANLRPTRYNRDKQNVLVNTELPLDALEMLVLFIQDSNIVARLAAPFPILLCVIFSTLSLHVNM